MVKEIFSPKVKVVLYTHTEILLLKSACKILPCKMLDELPTTHLFQLKNIFL